MDEHSDLVGALELSLNTTQGEVIDVFTAAGLSKPDTSILSDQFLAVVRGLQHKNLAAELLQKLLKDELKVRSKRNFVHDRSDRGTLRLAQEMDATIKRGEDPGLTDDEGAFYEALAANESAIQAMGDEQTKVIAAVLISKVRQSVTIDWTLCEGARAKIRVMVKRILNKYGFPPDLQEGAVKTVLEQAESEV